MHRYIHSSIEKIFNFLKTSNTSNKILVVTLSFYCTLLTLNLNNKLIAVAFIGLTFVYYKLTKNFRHSLWLSWLASTIILTGKQFRIEVFRPGIYSTDVFPIGIYELFIVTPKHIITAFMALIIARDLLKGNSHKKLSSTDILIMIYFIWPTLNDILTSPNPSFSLMYSLRRLPILIAYYFSIYYLPKLNLKFINAVVISLVLFESLLVGIQAINRAPLYKNLEIQVDLEYWGHTADEKNLPFRPIGTFEHANYLGLWLAYFLMFTLAHRQEGNNSTKNLLIIILLGGLSMTLSRSSWIGAGVGFLYLAWTYEKQLKTHLLHNFGRKILPILIIMIPIGFLYLFPRMERSIYTFYEGGGAFRKFQNQEIIKLIWANPLNGVGSGQSLNILRDLDPKGFFSNVGQVVHNWFLLNAAEQGLPYIFMWFIIVFTSIKRNLKQISKEKNPTVNDFRIGWIASTFCLCIVRIFQPYITDDMIFIGLAIVETKDLYV